MSKDKPEIGDIWENMIGMKLYVLYSDDVTTSFYMKNKKIGKLIEYTVITRDFMGGFTYLGKSKVKLNEDLFELENER